MQRPVLFETERLIHRISSKDEFDTLYAIMADPGVRRWMGNGEPVPSMKIGRRLRSDVDQFAKHGAAHGMVIFKENMEVMGYGGVGRYDPEELDSLELGYQFKEQYWGMGIGSEFVKAVVDYGFEKQHAALIHACAMPENKASIRVMEKAGMVFEGYYLETNRNVYYLAKDGR